MSSVRRVLSERKRRKRIGPPRVIRREDYQGQDVNGRLELIRLLIPLGLIEVYEELEAEVERLAGPRYARKADGSAPPRSPSRGMLRWRFPSGEWDMFQTVFRTDVAVSDR